MVGRESGDWEWRNHPPTWLAPRTSKEAGRFARRLKVSKATLAKTIQVHPSALSRPKLSAGTVKAFAQLLAILNHAVSMAGNETRAVIWFKYEPIIAMGKLPAIEHVTNGDGEFVIQYMQMVEHGVYI